MHTFRVTRDPQNGAERFGRHPPYDGTGKPPAVGFLLEKLGAEGTRAIGWAGLLCGGVLLAFGEGIGLVVLVIFVLILALPSVLSLRGSWVEVDRAQNILRQHRPNYWPHPKEEPLSNFIGIDLIKAYDGDGYPHWQLVLLRRGLGCRVEVSSADAPDKLRDLISRLVEATGLPLGEKARQLFPEYGA